MKDHITNKATVKHSIERGGSFKRGMKHGYWIHIPLCNTNTLNIVRIKQKWIHRVYELINVAKRGN